MMKTSKIYPVFDDIQKKSFIKLLDLNATEENYHSVLFPLLCKFIRTIIIIRFFGEKVLTTGCL